MIICHSHQFIFIHIQRTGGSSIINLLKKQLKEDVEILTQHGNAKSPVNYLLEDFKDYFTFAFARNPWDRILSWYLLINQSSHQSLEEERLKYERFLTLDLAAAKGDSEFHYNQLDYLSDNEGKLLTRKIYRFEDYEREVDNMHKDLNLNLVDIPRMNNSIEKDYKAYYTLKSREIIAAKCKKDIEYFGYMF